MTPAYGSGHPFCLPLGPATLKPTECGLFNNTLNNRIYANVMPGATQYEFQFLDPDAGYVRSIIKPSASMLFIDMGGSVNPLVPGVHYFVRIRTNAQSNYCLPFCTITIDNAYTGMGGELTQVDGSFNGDVQMWPNPVADGRVNWP
ncbi:MAG: hypothetical protein IPL86_11845 [Flavobacteriales bacterium]|nr:hypothetical protein [Flavobacteriales bacterium]